jgi:hypothetical protein
LGILPLDVDLGTVDSDVSSEVTIRTADNRIITDIDWDPHFAFSRLCDEDMTLRFEEPVSYPTRIEVDITTVTTVSYTDSDTDTGPNDTQTVNTGYTDSDTDTGPNDTQSSS